VHIDGENLGFGNSADRSSPNCQALSRTTTVTGGSTSQRAIAIEGVEAWQLVVQSTQVIRFNIAQAQSNTTQDIQGQYCPQNGIVTFNGYGDALISVTNLTLIDAIVQLDFVKPYDVHRQHESESDSNNSNVVFKDVGEFGGWNPPYCEHLKIYANNPIKLRVINGVDLSVIWQENNITTPVWGTLGTMRTSNRDRIQFASETNLTVAVIRAIWSTQGT
tara:strand:- start:131 stop:787 length:657 start_codon:yes stop_codon:yes gene_type:complete